MGKRSTAYGDEWSAGAVWRQYRLSTVQHRRRRAADQAISRSPRMVYLLLQLLRAVRAGDFPPSGSREWGGGVERGADGGPAVAAHPVEQLGPEHGRDVNVR